MILQMADSVGCMYLDGPAVLELGHLLSVQAMDLHMQ